MKHLTILFNNNEEVSVKLLENPVADYVVNCIKHLKYVDIPYGDKDNPYNFYNIEHYKKKLMDSARHLGIDVDSSLLTQQSYLNDLHRLFETGYCRGHGWLEFHENIHLIEDINSSKLRPAYAMDYREFMGKLVKPFDRQLLVHSVTHAKAGTCFLDWTELGKTPWRYFKDQEPQEIQRICQLAKPWIYLKPRINVLINDLSLPKGFLESKDKFVEWFSPFRDEWCRHWNIPDWTEEEMFAIIPIGNLDIEKFTSLLQAGAVPKRIIQ